MVGMFEFQAFGVRWRFSLLFPAMLTALLLWRPDGLAVPCVLASLIHEGGHLLAMLWLGVPPQDFTLSAFGARMKLGDRTLGYRKNLVISLSGPLANGLSALIFVLCGRPMLTFVHILLAGVNLLPAMGLDGGEVLRCALCLMGWEQCSATVLRCTSTLVLLLITAGGTYILLQPDGNSSLLVIGLYLATLVFFADKKQKNS